MRREATMGAETSLCLSVLCIYVMTAPPPSPSPSETVSSRPTRVGKAVIARINLLVLDCGFKKLILFNLFKLN